MPWRRTACRSPSSETGNCTSGKYPNPQMRPAPWTSERKNPTSSTRPLPSAPRRIPLSGTSPPWRWKWTPHFRGCTPGMRAPASASTLRPCSMSTSATPAAGKVRGGCLSATGVLPAPPAETTASGSMKAGPRMPYAGTCGGSSSAAAIRQEASSSATRGACMVSIFHRRPKVHSLRPRSVRPTPAWGLPFAFRTTSVTAARSIVTWPSPIPG